MSQPPTEVQNLDISFTIYEGGKLLGDLHISKGNLQWWPSGNSVNFHSLGWSKLAKTFVDDGKKHKVNNKKTDSK
jgi:hypothetical protein